MTEFQKNIVFVKAPYVTPSQGSIHGYVSFCLYSHPSLNHLFGSNPHMPKQLHFYQNNVYDRYDILLFLQSANLNQLGKAMKIDGNKSFEGTPAKSFIQASK
jgi:hypothetical protein